MRMVMHRVDHPLIGKVNVFSSLHCCTLSYAHGDAPRRPASVGNVNVFSSLQLLLLALLLLLRMVMPRVDHPLNDGVNISFSLRYCSLSSSA